MDDLEPDATAPSTLGAADRYLIQRELGRGMMGVVYEALDTVLGRTVAVKTIEIAFTVRGSEREAFERRFFTEARVAANLSHPGIVVCHDVGKDPESGKLFIVFEHLKGRTLGERVAEGRVPWREAVSIMARIARAIHHAHAHGVIHRDLKPANVMLLEPGEEDQRGTHGEAAVKIMDFGVAKVESVVRRLTVTGTSFGSPLYMSPEQALGESADARSDIFSLGSVLCTLLLGRGWFEAPSIPEILARVIHGDPPVISTLLPGLPADLDRILARSMARRGEERYPTAAAMADDLDDVLAGRPPRHAGDPTPSPVPSPGAQGEDSLLSELTSPADVEPAAAGTGNVLADLLEAPPPAVKTVRAARRRPLLLYGVGAAALAGAAALVVAYGTLDRGTTVPPTDAATATPTPTATDATGPGRTEAGLPPAPGETLAPSPEGPTESPTAPPPPEPVVADAEEQPGPTAEPLAGVKPKPPAQVPIAADTEDQTGAMAEPLAGVAPAPPPAPPSTPPPAEVRSHIRLAVEHSLENGRLIVWVDGVVVFETRLRAETPGKSGGRLERDLDVAPGRHEVRVEVSWGDTRRLETQIVDVAPQTTGLLEVRLGGLIKSLGLHWTSPAP